MGTTMELLLQRLEHTDLLTTSILFVERKLYATCPEDPPQAVKVRGNTRIPAGRYKLALVDSPKFSERYGHRLLMLLDVPGFTGIMIHKGNDAADTMGCILPNAHLMLDTNGGNMFYMSGLAYDKLYKEVAPFIEAGGEAWITVRDEDWLFSLSAA